MDVIPKATAARADRTYRAYERTCLIVVMANLPVWLLGFEPEGERRQGGQDVAAIRADEFERGHGCLLASGYWVWNPNAIAVRAEST